MAVASKHLGVWSWSRQKKGGMVVGARWVGLLGYWDFHTQPFLGFTKNV